MKCQNDGIRIDQNDPAMGESQPSWGSAGPL